MDFRNFYGEYIEKLRESAGQLYALCPFHDDQKESWSANAETGLWKCHAGCGSGNAVQFADRLRIPRTEVPGYTAKGKAKMRKEIIRTYDYRDENGEALFQTVRFEPKEFRQRRPNGKGGWIWNLKGVQPVLYRLPELMKGSDPVVIVEGEKDVERLMELGSTATTNPLGAGKWRRYYNKWLDGRDVVVIPDNDDPGRDHARTAAKSLQGVAKTVKVLELPNLPEKGDVSDFLDMGGTAEELKRLIEEAPLYPDSSLAGWTQDIKNLITDIRKDKDLRAFEKMTRISEVVLEDLESRGFLVSTSTQRFFFQRGTNTLFELDGFRFQALVNDLYGLNPSEHGFDYVLANLHTEAHLRGQQSEVYQLACYSKENGDLYISRFDGRLYCLDGEKIELLPNGSGGVLFLDDPLWEPYEYLGTNPESEFLSRLLIDAVNFAQGEGVVLSPEDQRMLFQVYIYSAFFESLLPTKPIIAFVGPKGSGKSSTLLWLGQLLFGSSFRLLSLAKNKEDGFIAAVTASYLAGFDNVDGKIPWLNDHLAALATGGSITLRKLYTTNEKITFNPRVFLALTSRSPKFRREDVVDRLLLLRVARFQKFKSEKKLREERLAKRNELWTELLNDLNQIVKALRADNEEFTTVFRMADWADLGWRIAKTQGIGDKFLETLQRMEQEQTAFFMEGEPLCDVLEIFLEETANHGKKLAARDLYPILSGIADDNRIRWPYKNSRSLAQRLSNIRSSLAEFLNIAVEKGRGNVTRYQFWPKGELTETTRFTTESTTPNLVGDKG